jgi:alkaline phosphatase
MSLSRRSFLSTAALGALAAGLPLRGALSGRPADSSAARAREPGRARNLVLVVSDGMSAGTLATAEQFRRRRDGRGTAWIDLHRDAAVRRGLMDTASAYSLVTDSAAAASAWGGGLRVNNGALNIGPAGQRPVPLFALARAEGRAAGLVSTATITHATPAGFAINAPGRNAESDIADLYVKTGIDLFLGGGNRFFDPALRPDKHDAYAAFRAAGYHVARDRAALAAAPAGPLLGVFSDGHLPYALDHASDPALVASTPTLAEMSELALARLPAAGGDRGFVLQIEGARIDHAAHANDFSGLVHDQLALDDALDAVLRFAAGRDDTLVIVTTDHANANPGLNSHGADTDRLFANTFPARHTNNWIVAGLAPDSSVAAIRERVEHASGVALTDDEAALLGRALRDDYTDAYRARRSPVVILGQLLSNHYAIGWNGIAHTSDFVDVLAFGPGSETLPGFLLNTDLHTLMHRALGLPDSGIS